MTDPWETAWTQGSARTGTTLGSPFLHIVLLKAPRCMLVQFLLESQFSGISGSDKGCYLDAEFT